ncbi:MAG: DUF5985 family protein [Caulobacteraceae bacterium]
MIDARAGELFVSGALCAGFLVAAGFFLSFWRRTRDGLFAAFSIAFLLMAANQGFTGFTHTARGEDAAAFLLRLAAFGVIILGVLAKNAQRNPRSEPPND